MSLPPLLTHSLLTTHQLCQRKRHYCYDRRRRALRRSKALAFGTLWHLLCESYWKARQNGEARDARWTGVHSLLQRELVAYGDRSELTPYDGAKMLAMIAMYVAIWDARPCEVIFVEKEFRAPLLHPVTGIRTTVFDLGGKIDLCVRLPDNRLAIVEHKSSRDGATIGSEYRARLTLDGQVSQYWNGARALGYEPDVAIYDVAVKPQKDPHLATPLEDRKFTAGTPATPDRKLKDGTIKPGKPAVPPRLYATQREHDEPLEDYQARITAEIAENPTRYFQQVELVRLERQEEDYRFDVWAYAHDIRESKKRDPRYIPRNTGNCWKYGRCEYLPVCEHLVQLEDDSVYRDATSEHEELRGEDADDVST